jgi:hypothetical protein
MMRDIVEHLNARGATEWEILVALETDFPFDDTDSETAFRRRLNITSMHLLQISKKHRHYIQPRREYLHDHA